jgi:hypothetical protein
MILVLSGEGPTDLGTTRLSEAGREFVPGPMAWIVDRLLALPGKLGYSILETHAGGGECVCFLNKADLAALRPKKPMFFLRGGNATNRNLFFFKSAFLLGKRAKTIATERNSPVIAVYFRDADGTRSTPRSEWNDKFQSMRNGFQMAEFQSGAPMVPRPKSEAWMLCGLLKREDTGRDCGWLEEEPGNDASPRSLKVQLETHLAQLGCIPTAEQQAELVSSGLIDPALIDLGSFKEFCKELDRAYALAAQPLN